MSNEKERIEKLLISYSELMEDIENHLERYRGYYGIDSLHVDSIYELYENHSSVPYITMAGINNGVY